MRPPARRALPLLAALVATLAVPAAAAQEEPGPFEPVRQLLAYQVLPLAHKTYDQTACAHVGGYFFFKPPGDVVTKDLLGFGCDTPYCPPTAQASVFCYRKERAKDWDQGFCETYVAALPETVAVPGQNVVGPAHLKCVNALHHTSFVHGFCNQAVQVMCQRAYGDVTSDCYLWSNFVGCVTVEPSVCKESVQVLCYETKPIRFCILYVKSMSYCETLTPKGG